MLNKILSLVFFLSIISFAQLVGPKVAVQQIEYDFGQVEQGKIVKHDYIISNNGGDVLKINNVRASCGCTAAKPDDDEIKPGQSTLLHVEFNSKGRMGRQLKHIYVSTNDDSNSQLVLTLKGSVIKNVSEDNSAPRVQFPETHYDFGKVKEGEVVNHTFKFLNAGTSELEIKDIKTSCGCTAALVSSKNIKPGDKGTIRVELDTKNRKGKMSRTVTVMTNDPEEPNKVLTIYAEVEGT